MRTSRDRPGRTSRLAPCSAGRDSDVPRRTTRSVRIWQAGLGCLLALTALSGCTAYAQPLDENQVKAAFVFNLTKFVDWPHAGKDLTIGFVGDGPMGNVLQEMLSGKLSGSRPIRVVLSPSEETLRECDVVFLAYGSSRKLREAIGDLANGSILTVGDTDSFVKSGGMVGLVTKGNQIQIQVNLQAVQAAHLTISSRLLSLADVIDPRTGTTK